MLRQRLSLLAATAPRSALPLWLPWRRAAATLPGDMRRTMVPSRKEPERVQLEVWSAAQVVPATQPLTPLLFVHGGFHGAWCFENFVRWFAARGYAAYSMSVRSHGASTPVQRSMFWTLGQYVDDIQSVVAHITAAHGQRAPVLCGHSAGGGMTQKFLETYPGQARGGVLLCAHPPQDRAARAAIMRNWREVRLAPMIVGTHARSPRFCSFLSDEVVSASGWGSDGGGGGCDRGV